MTSPASPPRVAHPDEAVLRAKVDRLCKVTAIPSDVLRARAAGAELEALTPPEAALVLSALLRRRRDEPEAAAAVAAISRALARGNVDQEHVEQILGCARSRADRLVEALLASGPALREYDHNEEQFVDRRLRRISLGERRALSRTRDVDLLLRLAHDQDPRVIQGLLQNPRTTEREAVLIAARRPTHINILEAVLSSRFGLSSRVRSAVAHNPYASVALASRALATLPAQELRALVTDERIAREVRDRARAVLVGRRGTPAEFDLPDQRMPRDEAAEALLASLSGAAPEEEDEIIALDREGRPIDSWDAGRRR